jgi:multidrug efflux system membrane fusion protein
VLAYLAIEGAPGLRQGLFAQGTIATGQSQSLTLPPGTIRNDKPLPYVQLVSNDQIVHQPVVLGAAGEFEGQRLVTVTGVPENATVVAGSVGALRAGTRVKLASPGSTTSPASAASGAK